MLSPARIFGTLVALGAVVACSSSAGTGSGNDPGVATPTTSSSGQSSGFGQAMDPTDPAEMPNTDIQGAGCGKIDVLFVVDDSPSMAEEQSNLGKNFPEFVKVLDEFKTQAGAPIDFRIAVTTTGRDLNVTRKDNSNRYADNMKGDNGAFRTSNVCDVPGRWLSKGEQDIARKFGCIAKVGTSGPWLEMPLYAAKLAFDDRVADGTNKGFLREDALLAIVVLTDEDDCSREDNNFEVDVNSLEQGCGAERRPITQYADYFDTVAPKRWATHIIAGPGPGTCNSSGLGNAAEGTRLKEFALRAGKNGSFSSICDGDLSSGLKQALVTFDSACKAVPAQGPK